MPAGYVIVLTVGQWILQSRTLRATTVASSSRAERELNAQEFQRISAEMTVAPAVRYRCKGQQHRRHDPSNCPQS